MESQPRIPSKVRKRDGSLQDFDQSKIYNAIKKALLATRGECDHQLCTNLTHQVLDLIGIRFGDSIPEVEGIQDIVEEVLMKNKLYQEARNYIKYRYSRTQLRQAKLHLGVWDDLKLAINAMRLLSERYLLKDEHGNILETPKQMFARVARYVAQAEGKYGLDPDPYSSKFYRAMVNLEFIPNCLAGDTLIPTQRGLIPIRELVSLNRDVKLVTDSGWALATEFYSNGPNKALKVTTQHGYQIVATPKHFFRVVDSRGNYVWKQLEQISPQDRLVLQLSFLNCIGEEMHIEDGMKLKLPAWSGRKLSKGKLPKSPLYLNHDLAEFLGYVHGEGAIHGNRIRVPVDLKRLDVLEWLKNIYLRIFNQEPKLHSKENHGWKELSSVYLLKFLHENGLRDPGIPDKILRSPPQIISGFLRGIFEADGLIHHETIQLSSRDEITIRHVQLTLLGLGIVSRANINRSLGIFRLLILRKQDRANFFKFVGFISDFKRKSLASLSNRRLNPAPRSSQSAYLAESSASNLNPKGEVCQKIWESIEERETISAGSYEGNASSELMHEHSSHAALAGNQFYDRVASMEEVEVDTFDLHVPIKNAYIANGFVVHNSPTLMNAGTRYPLLSACFTGDQPILTPEGFKPISELKIGEYVFTHSGKLKPITHTFERDYFGELIYVEVEGLPKPALKLTPEHPVLGIKREDLRCIRIKNLPCTGIPREHCFKKPREYKSECKYLNSPRASPSWILAEDLKEGDYVVVPNYLENHDKEWIELPVAEGYCAPEDGFIHKTMMGWRHGVEAKPIPAKVKLDSELMLLLGLYLSEGSAEGNCVRFALNSDEYWLAKLISQVMESKFGIKAPVECGIGNWIGLRFHSVPLAHAFRTLFGTGFDQKRIPTWILQLPNQKLFWLVLGAFMGDGHLSLGKSGQYVVEFTVSNQILASQFWCIARKLGFELELGTMSPNLSNNKAYRMRGALSQCSKLAFYLNPSLYLKYRNKVGKLFGSEIKLGGLNLKKITRVRKCRYSGKVYNLEVEEDSSYLASGIAVHNCFVLPIEDSMESIFDTLKIAAKIQQYGGGVGYDFSPLRPEGDIVLSTMGTSSGPCSFIKIFDSASEQIKAGGRRRGANMGILRCDHPDILKFIWLKQQHPKHNPYPPRNFNFSVAITDEFMHALEHDDQIPLINPRDGSIRNYLPAKTIFENIVSAAHRTGDPGLIFIDTINRYHPLPYRITATNPCITGDTLIAVADGRNAVPIKQLAEEANPVPVYCKDPDGWTHIRWARNIRLTRHNAPVYKVTLEDGSSFRATPDHLVMLSDGSYARVIDLEGRKLMGFNSVNPRVCCVEFAGYEDVYDMHVDAFHNFCIITNGCSGVVLHNCGEQPLLPWESCNLGSINLAKFVEKNEIQWERLEDVVRIGVRFLDDVIDVNWYPVPQIQQATKANRKIGLGVMGFAEMLLKLEIKYDSPEAESIAEELMEFISNIAREESNTIAHQKGSFPNFQISSWAKKYDAMRNATLTTIAPTGSISIIAGTTSGIEPIFAVCFFRKVLGGSLLPEVNPVFEQIAKQRGFYSQSLIAKIAKSGSLQGIQEVPDDLKQLFVTAYEISPEWHLRIQAAFQKHTDNAVSKTINLPFQEPMETVARIFKRAYYLGCKGVTVFRYGALSEQVIYFGKDLEGIIAESGYAGGCPADLCIY